MQIFDKHRFTYNGPRLEAFRSIHRLPPELLALIYQMLGTSDLVQFSEKIAYLWTSKERRETVRLARVIYYRNLDRQFRLDHSIAKLCFRRSQSGSKECIPQSKQDSASMTCFEYHSHRVLDSLYKIARIPTEMFHADAGSLAKKIVQKDIDAVDNHIKNRKIKITFFEPSPPNLDFYTRLDYIRSEETLRSPLRGFELDFGGVGLCHLPEKVCQFTSVIELKLISNRLSFLPRDIQFLSLLVRLDVSHNYLVELPDELGMLKNLKHLILFNNQLEELPNTVGNLINLTILHLRKNKLKVLPNTIGELKSLYDFNLSDNQLEKIPNEVGNLTNLIHFDLSRNQLAELPETIGCLISLEKLFVMNNKLVKLPNQIGNLINLVCLNLYKNKLDALPETIGHLKNLHFLTVSNNPLEKLPDTLHDLVNLFQFDLSDTRIKKVSDTIRNQIRFVYLLGRSIL